MYFYLLWWLIVRRTNFALILKLWRRKVKYLSASTGTRVKTNSERFFARQFLVFWRSPQIKTLNGFLTFENLMVLSTQETRRGFRWNLRFNRKRKISLSTSSWNPNQRLFSANTLQVSWERHQNWAGWKWNMLSSLLPKLEQFLPKVSPFHKTGA